jgi:hypothetical protein
MRGGLVVRRAGEARLWPSDVCDFDCNYTIECSSFRLLTSTFAWCACFLQVTTFFCPLSPSSRALQLSSIQNAGHGKLDISVLPIENVEAYAYKPSSLLPPPRTPLIRRHLVPTIIARRLTLFHTLQPSFLELRPQIANHIKIRMPQHVRQNESRSLSRR